MSTDPADTTGFQPAVPADSTETDAAPAPPAVDPSVTDSSGSGATQAAGDIHPDTQVSVAQPVAASDLPADTEVVQEGEDPASATSVTSAGNQPADTRVLPTGTVRAGDLPPDTIVTVYTQPGASSGTATVPQVGVAPGAPSGAVSEANAPQAVVTEPTDSTSSTIPAGAPGAPVVTTPSASAPTVSVPTGATVNDPAGMAYGTGVSTKEVQVEAGQTLDHIAKDAGVAVHQVYLANAAEIERVARDELGLVASWAGRYIKAGMKLLVPDNTDSK